MSIYEVNYLCYRVLRHDSLRDAMRSEPQAVLDGLELTDDERAALLAGDVATLYRLGAHEYLLYNLSRAGVLGLTPALFSDRIRAAAQT